VGLGEVPEGDGGEEEVRRNLGGRIGNGRLLGERTIGERL